MKRLFLAIALILMISPCLFTGSAAAEEVINEGYIGSPEGTGKRTNIRYQITEDGTMTFTGYGPMENNRNYLYIPWKDYTSRIKTVVVGSGITSIGDWAFFGCNNLADVSLPDGLTVIGKNAFTSCASLSGLSLPGQLSDIGEAAFQQSGLTALTIPAGVTSLGDTLCASCDKLSEVTILGGVEAIPRSAFAGCTALASVTLPDTVTAIGDYAFHSNAFADFDMPAGVFSIGKGAFHSCAKLTAIALPDGLEAIADETFYNCPLLGNVAIPASVKSIGKEAFDQCFGFTAIELPEGVVRIGKGAFESCSNVAALSLPESLRAIDDSAFQYCSGLERVTMPQDIKAIGSNVFASCHRLKLDVYKNSSAHAYADSNGIPFELIQVETVDSGSCGNDLTWTLDDRGTLIISGTGRMKNYGLPGYYSSDSAPWLQSAQQDQRIKRVIIEAGAASIGKNAFYNCAALTSADIPGSVTSIGESAFYGCGALEDITIPEGVTSIGDRAFMGSALSTLALPDGLKVIDLFAFTNCKKLQNVSFPENNLLLSGYTFMGCKGLTELTLPAGLSYGSCQDFDGCTGLKRVTFGEGSTQTANSMFMGCTGLESVEIPDSVTKLGCCLFSGCTSLRSAKLPANPQLTEILYDTFKGCESLTEVTLANNIKTIGQDVFSGCASLTDVYFTGTESDRSAIALAENNDVLDSAVWHYIAPVWSINLDTAMENGSVLADPSTAHEGDIVTLTAQPESGWKLGAMSVWLGETQLTLADDGTFTMPAGDVTVYATFIPESIAASGTCGESATWTLDDAGVLTISGTGKAGKWNEAGVTYDHWGNYQSSIQSVVIEEGITGLYDYALAGCAMTSIDFPNTLTEIQDFAFYRCTALTTVTLPENLRSLGKSAFYECSKLSAVYFPDNVESIGSEYVFYGTRAVRYASYQSLTARSLGKVKYAFADPAYPGFTFIYAYSGGELLDLGCGFTSSTATQVTIPEGVTSLGIANGYTLDGICDCPLLTDITFPDTLVKFSYHAIDNCVSLEKVDIPENLTWFSGVTNCPKIKSLTIPAGVTQLQDYSFTGCNGLETLYLPANIAFTGFGIVFNGLPQSSDDQMRTACKIYVPMGSVTQQNMGKLSGMIVYYVYGCDHLTFYTDSDGKVMLRGFDNQVDEVTIPEGVTELDQRVFGAGSGPASNIRKVTFPSTMKAINTMAFIQCVSLETVVLNEGLESIGNSAFADCTALKTIRMPGSVKTIGSCAFNRCALLESVGLNDGLESIGDSAFYDCMSLREVVIPDSVVSIGESAFPGEGETLVVSCTSAVREWIESREYYRCAVAHRDEEELSAVEPTCEDTGLTAGRYCKACGEDTVPQEIIAARGHDWGSTSYTWSDDDASVTARRVCDVDASHVETETVAASGSETKAATCTVKGEMTYTSNAFTNPAFEIQTKTLETDALGHSWGEPTYTWADDYGSVTARRTCARDASHLETEKVQTTMRLVKSPTDTTAGQSSFTAAFKNDAFAAQTKTVADIPALGTLSVLRLPSMLKTISEEAFMNLSCEAVIIPDGCTAIGRRAFMGCSKLIYIRIPASVTEIAEDAFDGCGFVRIDREQ